MTIEELIEKHHGERTFFDHELVGVYFTMQNLEALVTQAVEEFKASLVNVGSTYKASNGYVEAEFNDLVKAGIELYTLGKTK